MLKKEGHKKYTCPKEQRTIFRETASGGPILGGREARITFAAETRYHPHRSVQALWKMRRKSWKTRKKTIRAGADRYAPARYPFAENKKPPSTKDTAFLPDCGLPHNL